MTIYVGCNRGAMRLKVLVALWFATVSLQAAAARGQAVAPAPSTATVRIAGKVAHPLVLRASDLAVLKRASISITDAQGRAAVYEGFPVTELLERAGAPLGKELRGPQMKFYVIVKGADGYQVVFALTEFNPGFTERVILLADRRNGLALRRRRNFSTRRAR